MGRVNDCLHEKKTTKKPVSRDPCYPSFKLISPFSGSTIFRTFQGVTLYAGRRGLYKRVLSILTMETAFPWLPPNT